MPIPQEDLYVAKANGLGWVNEHRPDTNIVSRAAENTIYFGRAVMRGTAALLAKLFASSTGLFEGVAVFGTQAGDIDNQQYIANDPIPVLDRGVVMVMSEEAVNPTDAVRIRHTAGTGSQIAGQFCKTADAGKTVLLKGARWADTTSASGVTALEMGGAPGFVTTADV